MALRTAGLHHVTLVTADADRAVAFYRDLLGLRLALRAADPDRGGGTHLFFGGSAAEPGTLLHVVEDAGGPRGGWGVGGLHHVALAVGTAAEQLRWKRRLSDAGVPVSGPYDRHWFTSIYFRDPDGQVVEIATWGPGYGADEPMEALGERVVIPPAGNMRGARDERVIATRTHSEPVPEITPGMVLDGIHHVTGITGDLEEAHRFFEGLGLRRVKRTVNQDDGRTPHHFWAHYDGRVVAPRSSVTLFGWPGSEYRARAGVGQSRQYALRARDPGELEEWRAHLRALGVQTEPVVERPWFHSFAFRAPDGQRLLMATDGPGFAGESAEPK